MRGSPIYMYVKEKREFNQNIYNIYKCIEFKTLNNPQLDRKDLFQYTFM